MSTDETDKLSLIHGHNAFLLDLLQLLRTGLGAEDDVVDFIQLLADRATELDCGRLAGGAIHVLESAGEHESIPVERASLAFRDVRFLVVFLLRFAVVAGFVAALLRGFGLGLDGGVVGSSGRSVRDSAIVW